MEQPDDTHKVRSLADGHVRRTPWFNALSSNLQCLVLRAVRIRTVAAGTLLAHRGTLPSHWTGVVHGVLKARACSAEGQVSSYVLAIRSEWIDCEELVQGVPRLHDVVAVNDSVVMAMDAMVFQHLLASSVEFCGFVLRHTSQQHRRILERLENDRGLPNIAVVAKTVAELARELGAGSSGAVELRQEDIAEFVGLSRQTVNQALKRLADEGLLQTRYSRVEVADLKALQSFVAA